MSAAQRRTGFVLLAGLLVLGAVLAAPQVWPVLRLQPRIERDASQERLDKAIGPLGPDLVVGQTFVSRHAGLNAIEVLLVVYDVARVLPSDAEITLSLMRQDAADRQVVMTLPAADLKHNERLVFSFAPLPDSVDATYLFTLHCRADYGLGCWHTEDEAYADGSALRNGEALPGDLYFATRYSYSVKDAMADLSAALQRGFRLLPALFVLLVLPGAVLLRFLRPSDAQTDLVTRAGLVSALSLAFWPLLLLWCTAVGARLRAEWVWVAAAALAAVGVVMLARDARSGRISRRWHLSLAPEERVPLLALLMVLAGVAATRALQVRGLLVPPWVDSLHHTVVTQLIADAGQVPTTGAPYLQLADFHYHFGFHASAALLMALAGLPAHRAVLVLGQVLNTLTALSACVLAVKVSQRRWAGVVAALAAGLLSTMPAYYLSWGRYTQLAGMVLLPFACIAADWALSEVPLRPRRIALAGLLAAGLLVVHYRVLILYGLYVVVLVVTTLSRERLRARATRAAFSAVLAVMLLALLLTLPWALRLVTRVVPNIDALYAGWEAPAGYNDASTTNLLRTDFDYALLIAAGLGALWGLVRRRAQVIGIALWTGLWYIGANLHLVGLPDIWLLNNASVLIAVWLPASVLAGWLLADVVALLRERASRLAARWQLPWHRMLASGGLVIVTAATGWLGWQKVDVVNPVTVLLFEDDLRAIEWSRENLPADALVLVNSRLWQGDIHVGTDGGWWLPVLAGRRATLPSILYHQGPSEDREAVNSFAALVEQAPSLDDPALVGRLAAEGVTHVFVGARAGRLLPKELDASDHYRAVFVHGAARVYAFEP